MNNKKGQVAIIAVVAIALIAAGFYFFENFGSSSANAVSSDGGNSVSDSINEPTQSGITRDELATHDSETDCWIAYKGKVYDITSWLTEHPGGVNAILPNCGTAEQFEQAFTKKHGIKMVPLLMQVGKLMGDFDYRGNLQN